MESFVKGFLVILSENDFLNAGAKRWGLKLGAKRVVAGVSIAETIATVKRLNEKNVSCTIDNLGEFVADKNVAIAAKERIVQVIEAINHQQVDAHISFKPSQLGLDIDYQFCLNNVIEIVSKAKEYDIFVNFDMEDYTRLQVSFDLFEAISKRYNNVGTVIQAYFFRAEMDISRYKEFRLRIVKGAYKESNAVAFQEKLVIDEHYRKLIEWHLVHGGFTSIATHDHHIINHVKAFVAENKIAKTKFEFQMLYGFREDLLVALEREGYKCCVYVPFGDDWYGYFMRRLAERPQNINLLVKQVFNKKTNTLICVGLGVLIAAKLIRRKNN